MFVPVQALSRCLALTLMMSLLPSQHAWSAGGHETYHLKWPVPSEALSYHACGCADACWVAELRDKPKREVKATLRCDCEMLHFSASGRSSVADISLGTCAPLNESMQKFELIPSRLRLLTKVAALPKPGVTRALDRAESCLHLSGEFGGDGSERDREINREMAHLRCDDALDSLRVLKARLLQDESQRQRVTELLQGFE